MSSDLPIVLVGVNHQTLELGGRERVAEAFKQLGEAQDTFHQLGLHESVVLSTCNRFEVVGVGDDSALHSVRAEILRVVGGADAAERVYALMGAQAIAHLFRVTGSLDSMVVGEAQILGQVKEAYRRSVANDRVRSVLHRLFQSAFHCAKRIRTHTEIGDRGVSVSYVAVELARQIFGDLSEASVLVLGSGEMAELTLVHLYRQGCRTIQVANRTVERAAELAARIGGSALPLSEVTRLLPHIDIVIGSLAIDRPLLPLAAVKNQQRARPLFLIDLGVPRNFAEGLGQLEGVYLYNIDDLAAVVDQNRELRDDARQDAELIVQYATLIFEHWHQRYLVTPAVVDLRARLRQHCSRALQGLLELGVNTAADPRFDHTVNLLLEQLYQEAATLTSVSARSVDAGHGISELDTLKDDDIAALTDFENRPDMESH